MKSRKQNSSGFVAAVCRFVSVAASVGATQLLRARCKAALRMQHLLSTIFLQENINLTVLSDTALWTEARWQNKNRSWHKMLRKLWRRKENQSSTSKYLLRDPAHSQTPVETWDPHTCFTPTLPCGLIFLESLQEDTILCLLTAQLHLGEPSKALTDLGKVMLDKEVLQTLWQSQSAQPELNVHFERIKENVLL